ncbi:uncharacterized protein LOC129712369 isoform X2 [Leucoraja erinacea]|uniref:uncharacterized protein LOC129712369 isoform X2 n=1 Tax=Leucoraja erinaceus TaxID=7782 RepID=UPI002453E79E|nr:uncharacterized protein LOC129712369 isoform X2 [Leucoraja erinacea]
MGQENRKAKIIKMKIQITALVLLVATLVACDAVPLEEETSSSSGPIDSIRTFAQGLVDSAKRVIQDLSTNPTIQSGREWISTRLEQVPQLIQAKREELSQAFQQFTGQDSEQ